MATLPAVPARTTARRSMMRGPRFVLRAGPFDLTGEEPIPGTQGCCVELLTDADHGVPVAEERQRVARLRDGEAVADGPFGNKAASFPVLFKAATSPDLNRGIAAFWRWAMSPDTYTWEDPDGFGVPTTFEVLRAHLKDSSTDQHVLRNEALRTLDLECLPFGMSPDVRVTDTYIADGSVVQVPVVGSARTPASVEVWSIDDAQLREVLVVAHPSLDNGFSPLLQRAAGSNPDVQLDVPLAGLPRGAFALLGPSGEGRISVNQIVEVETTLGNYESINGFGATTTTDIVNSAISNFATLAVLHLPPRDVAPQVSGRIRLLVQRRDLETNELDPFSPSHRFFLVPLDDDTSITTTHVSVKGSVTSTNRPFRLWLDAGDLATRGVDTAWEGTTTDRSDDRALQGMTRWTVPLLKPSWPDGTTSIMVFAGNGLSDNQKWRLRYRPRWVGMAPE